MALSAVCENEGLLAFVEEQNPPAAYATDIINLYFPSLAHCFISLMFFSISALPFEPR